MTLVTHFPYWAIHPLVTHLLFAMNATLSPNRSPTVQRRHSNRRRAPSHLPPTTQEIHNAALHAIRNFLKGRKCYDVFPVSFRLIVLDTKMVVEQALECFLLNGGWKCFGCKVVAHRVFRSRVFSFVE
jgi:hypothetical protein